VAEEERARYEALSEAERAAAAAPLEPLKLVIMSATLRVEDFTSNPRLFPRSPPVVRVEARQYPVSIHFNRQTDLDDYLEPTFSKVCKIHRQLPEGGVLVFLTGKAEIMYMCRKLNKELNPKKRRAGTRRAGAKAAAGDDTKSQAHEEEGFHAREVDDDEEDAMIQDGDDRDDFDDMASEAGSEEDEDSSTKPSTPTPKAGEGGAEGEGAAAGSSSPGASDPAGPGPVHVLPLYAMLTPEEQGRVFRPPPEGHRLIVVATNVAETSVTIPGIKYVVDCGRVKQRVFDHAAGISQFKVQWVSQASADQRAGRAGRTGEHYAVLPCFVLCCG
jgi:ATP-dependent RNA helicase DHX37/DHR1